MSGEDGESTEDDGVITHKFRFLQSGQNLEFVSTNFKELVRCIGVHVLSCLL